MNDSVQVINHPLVQHKLSLMRIKDTSTRSFRILIREVGTLPVSYTHLTLPTKA